MLHYLESIALLPKHNMQLGGIAMTAGNVVALLSYTAAFLCREEVWPLVACHRTWKHLDMCIMTRVGLLPLDKMSRRSAVDTK